MTSALIKQQRGEMPEAAKCGEYIAADEQDTDVAEQEGEDEVMTREELLGDLDQALKEVRLYLDGKLKLKTAEEFLAELERETLKATAGC